MKGLLFILVLLVVFVIFYWKAPHFPYQPSMSCFSRLSKEKLDTGDILLFSSQTSKMLKYLFANQWTHVGLVYRDPQQKLWVWESNLPIDPADKRGRKTERKSGPKLVDLETKVCHYRGYTAVRHLRQRSLPPLSSSELTDRMGRCVAKYHPAPFETNYRRYANLFLQHDPKEARMTKKNAPSGIFCSQLVAQTLQDMGIMKNQRDAAYHWPHYFSNTSPSVHALDQQLEKDFYYEPEVHLLSGR